MDRTRLVAVVDRIMPADRDGGAIAFGALDYLDGLLATQPKLGAAIAAGRHAVRRGARRNRPHGALHARQGARLAARVRSA